MINLNLVVYERQKSIFNELSSLLGTNIKKLTFISVLNEVFTCVDLKTINIVLIDFDVISSDAFDVLSKLKKEFSDVVIVGISEFKNPQLFLELIELKIDKFLIKPIQIDELFLAFKSIIQIKNAQKRYEYNEKVLLEYKKIVDENNCVFEINSEGTIVYANKKFLELSGYCADEIINKPYKELSVIQDFSFFDTIFKNTHTQNRWSVSLTYKKKSGELFYTDTNVSALCNEHNEITTLIVINNDVTTLKNVEYELIRKDRMLLLQSKMAAMGEMIANIAHQWRQPLNTIKMCATSIQVTQEIGMLKIDDELHHMISSINESATYMNQTITDFQNYFKPNKKESCFSLKELFHKANKLLSAQYKLNNIMMIENIEEVTLCSYENEFLQVIVNILKNAVDELFNVHTQRYIFIDAYASAGNIIIKIKDNAGGAKEEIIGKIFEPYFTTKKDNKGTGLGLYMSKDIIEKHLNGEVSTKNVTFPYEQTTFTGLEFTLKLKSNN